MFFSFEQKSQFISELQDHNWILKQRASQTNPNLEEENGKEAHDMTRHT